ncbi:MAG: hypothetical protein ABI421_12075 [Polyangiaceae bacterium]
MRGSSLFYSVFLILIFVVACSTPDADSRTITITPDRASFDPVAAALDRRCGTLDCHGSRYRNLRMWGQDGMRLGLGDIPGGAQTTTAEIDSMYSAITQLEPEIMSEVVADHGQNPERLTLIRKARGTEKHAGGAILIPGDVRDRCLLSWLEGKTDGPACSQALLLP